MRTRSITVSPLRNGAPGGGFRKATLANGQTLTAQILQKAQALREASARAVVPVKHTIAVAAGG